ncbi:MAG: transglutaminase family protein [Thermoleophilia bacterium]
MFDRLIGGYRRINPRRTPENSVALRLSVLTSIVIAEITILGMGYYNATTGFLVPALTLAGFAVSWRRREQHNLGLKFVLSLLVLLATAFFLRDLAGNYFDTRLPLIRLLLWLQVLHSFDVPARRDLKFSLISGVTLMAAGAVLSTGMLFIAGLACFSIAAVVALVYFHLSEQSAAVTQTLPVRPGRLIAYGTVVWFISLLAAIPVLLLIPQNSQARLRALPFSELQRVLGDFSGAIINPQYQDNGNPFDGPPQYNPNSYYGFNNYMDLRSRGNLTDDLVMKVKADSYNFYRGIVFDEYNGKGWEVRNDETVEVATATAPFDLNLATTAIPKTRSGVESFYIEADLPNIIFSSWKPGSLFFPADRIKVDAFGGLRSPFPLTDGTVYTVMTDKPVFAAETLRAYPRAKDAPAPEQYTQLPDSGSLLEVERLARQISQPYNNRYDRVQAIQRYLKENYRYDLNIAPQNRDMDAVAYFLFEEKAGYCEHFASAMAVMSRSVGIPARVVTGYAGGEYNPFTGLWEIRQSDAHAWVEIYFGGQGWVPFDPTPGFDAPAGGSEEHSSWIAGQLFSYLSGALGDGPVGQVLGATAGFTGNILGAVRGLPLTLITGVVMAAAMVLSGSRRALRPLVQNRRRRRRLVESLGADYLKVPVLHEYFTLASELQELGLVRKTDETLARFADRVTGYIGAKDFVTLSRMVETLRYGNGGMENDQMLSARRLSQSVMEKIEARKGREPKMNPVTSRS